MNNLLSKVGLAATLAATSMFYNGCATTTNHNAAQQQELEERMLGLALGGWMINKGVQQNNVAGVAVGDALVGSAVQRTSQNNVYVNTAPSVSPSGTVTGRLIPASAVEPKPMSYEGFVKITGIYDYGDVNQNRKFDSNEPLHELGNTLTPDAVKIIGLNNVMGIQFVKISLSDKNGEKILDDNIMIQPGANLYPIPSKKFKRKNLSPGETYRLTVFYSDPFNPCDSRTITIEGEKSEPKPHIVQ